MRMSAISSLLVWPAALAMVATAGSLSAQRRGRVVTPPPPPAPPVMITPQVSAVCAPLRAGANGAFHGFVPDPGDAWHQDVSNAPLAEDSDVFFRNKADLGGVKLHADFGVDAGIPYNVIDSAETPLRPVEIDVYPSDSDITLAPLPRYAAVEGSPEACERVNGDQHLIVVDRRTCSEYEYWQASQCNGKWRAANVAIFDLASAEKRPWGFTSADAAGLSILEGLVRYDEILTGKINHAIRFTAKATKKTSNGSLITAPAMHGAGLTTGTDNIMGMRIRLRKDFDISHFSRTNQIILTAMKTYGMILADNGASMFFQGTRDPRWDDDDLKQLRAVASSEFELVQMGPVLNTESLPKGPGPEIVAFTASPAISGAGMPVTLQATMSGGSYAFVDGAGFLRDGQVVVRPTVTTTYKLTVRNEYGSKTATVEVQVR